MKTMPFVALLGVCCLVFTAACQRDNHPRLPESGSGQITPSLSAFAIYTGGGSADGLAGQDGADGGSITITVQSGTLMRNDGRVVPNPTAPNFLTIAVMDDGVVSYPDLVSLQAPVIAGGLATFTLTGESFWLLNNISLDLSAAPNTGVTPASDVLEVEIITDEAVRIDGDIVTTRVGNDAVDLSFNSTHVDGIVVHGTSDARGRDGFDGGDYSLNAVNGAVHALGRIWTNGGAATSVLTAGDGGDVDMAAGLGDFLLRAGSLGTPGGLGQQDGGLGGNLVIDFAVSAGADYRWGVDSRGGMGRDGDGGNGGGVTISAGASNYWFARFVTSGGDANAGIGGMGGTLSITGYTHWGTVEVDSSGGNTSTGIGGDSGDAIMAGLNTHSLFLDMFASGGRGDDGGDGGDAVMLCDGLLDGVYIQLISRGGNGGTVAGNGGTAVITATTAGSVTVQDTTIYGDLLGGSVTAGTGGSGGTILIVDGGVAVMQVTNVTLTGNLDGGDGDDGGPGGDIVVASQLGAADADVSATSNGGDGLAGDGGAGGNTVMISDGGSVDLWVQVSSVGGRGTGGNGGIGGTLVAVSSDSGTAGGSTRVAGSYTGNGGSSDMAGGLGGVFAVDSGATGSTTVYQVQVDLEGGFGTASGGAGGVMDSDSVNSLLIDGGTIDLGGGGATTGQGGGGGTFTFATDEGSVQVLGLLRANGGAGATGGVGGTLFAFTDNDVSNDAGDFLVEGTITCNGGSGSTGAGGGGGVLAVDATASVGTSGNIVVHGSINLLGGSGTGGGDGGNVDLMTPGGIAITGSVNVNASGTAGDGGSIDLIGGASLITIGATARLRANGAGTGVAGFITLDPAGAGPNNPNLVESVNALVETRDGSGVDQSATNITRD